MWGNYLETSDIDPEIYKIITKKYATYKELQQDYSVNDIIDLLEVMDIENDLEMARLKDEEVISKQRKQ